MTSYQASRVDLLVDVDYGEGWITFDWPDAVFGHDQLTIDLDGYCSRRMPIHSGWGPPDFLELQRDRIRLRFAPELASKLKMDEEIEIVFALPDDDFLELRRAIEYFQRTKECDSGNVGHSK